MARGARGGKSDTRCQARVRVAARGKVCLGACGRVPAQKWAILVPLDSSFRDASNGILYHIL